MSTSAVAAAAAPAAASPASSRFATLKVFKFSKHSQVSTAVADDSDDALPPPPPPKDQFYSYSNRSATSLDPSSANRARKLNSPSLAPNRSTISLASMHSFSPSVASSSMTAPRKKDKDKEGASRFAKGLFKFAKRGTKILKAPEPQQSPDENISNPWNFQVRNPSSSLSAPQLTPASLKHNIHVDESYVHCPRSLFFLT
jgi:hypothetical protein